VTYSGKGSNRTFQLVVKNLPLIDTFRRVHTNIRDNFHLVHRSIRHAPASIKTTLEKVSNLLQKYHAYEVTTRAGPEYAETENMTDHFRQGIRILQTEKVVQLGTDNDDGDNNMEENTLNTEELELDDIRDL
jgi:hypothetical protein